MLFNECGNFFKKLLLILTESVAVNKIATNSARALSSGQSVFCQIDKMQSVCCMVTKFEKMKLRVK